MARGNDLTRISISLPGRLLAELDAWIAARGYASRSELVRDLIREHEVEARWRNRREEVVGVLTISYDHHQRELAGRIMEVQHSRYVNVLCTTHVHLDHHECLEVIILKGRPVEIERIGAALGSLKGVKLARLTKASRLEA